MVQFSRIYPFGRYHFVSHHYLRLPRAEAGCRSFFGKASPFFDGMVCAERSSNKVAGRKCKAIANRSVEAWTKQQDGEL
jgi:hypothetical protein